VKAVFNDKPWVAAKADAAEDRTAAPDGKQGHVFATALRHAGRPKESGAAKAPHPGVARKTVKTGGARVSHRSPRSTRPAALETHAVFPKLTPRARSTRRRSRRRAKPEIAWKRSKYLRQRIRRGLRQHLRFKRPSAHPFALNQTSGRTRMRLWSPIP